MAKKVIILFLLGLLILPLISAMPPFQESSATNGFDIRLPQTDVIKVNQTIEIHTHIHNRSDGLLVTNSTANCTVHLYNSTGNHIVEQQMDFDSNGIDFELEVNGANFTDVGRYTGLIQCNNTAFGGFVSFGVDATLTGQELTKARATIFIGLLMLLGFLFVASLFGISILPSNNERDEEGNLLSISKLKFVKPILYIVAYMILMAMTFIGSNIAFSYLGSTLVANVLFDLYFIMMTLTLPMVSLWIAFIMIKLFQDNEMKKMIERGVDIEQI